MTGRVLLVDDDRAMCDLLTARLQNRGYTVYSRTSGADALKLLETEDVDAVVADHNMPVLSGVELCHRITRDRPDLPVVMITAFGSMQTAIEAIRAGAYDFLPKPFEIEALVLTLDRALQHKALKDEVQRLRRVVAVGEDGEIVGEHPVMRRLHELIARAAESDATALITGESGTGKELVARALHAGSARRQRPFVAVNCAAVTESLLESELFGHRKGAFTDARESRPGLLAQAQGGTVFLDEIGDMPLGMQAKLLRALENRTVRPVGSDSEVPIDVRFVAATNRDLESDVEDGRFRRDLFFRINVIHITLPPLRARGNDVLVLAQKFLENAAARAGKGVVGLSTAAAERLLAYPWPGNVRELQNAVERAVALTTFERIAPEDLPERVRQHRQSQVVLGGDDPSALLPMHEVERRYILHVLETARGNKTMAARILGFDRRTMYRKLERFAEEANEETPSVNERRVKSS